MRVLPGVLTAVLATALAVLVAAVVAVGGSAAAPLPQQPGQRVVPARGLSGAQPVLTYRGFADPTVVRYSGGYVGVSTGPWAPRAVAPTAGGQWQDIESALLNPPVWATSPRIWAPDLVRIGSTWVLYFSAEAGGIGSGGRCIGAAVAASPVQPFIPQGRPLVCPARADASTAYDTIPRAGSGLPSKGAIDPEAYQDGDGTRYLMYRTQGTPSSIRIVELPGNGKAKGPGRKSVELARSRGVIENPSLLKRHGKYVLMTSEGYFGTCGYTSTWRRSKDLLDWSGSRRQVLLDYAGNGLCGPGGVDLIKGGSDAPLAYFHAWTCPELGTNCPTGHDYDRDHVYGAQRSLFGMVLRWTAHDAPRIASYVAPVLPPPPSPSPSPTPTHTIAPTDTATPSPRP
jgi:arabinan endo-1,5-alpha-L-arabinosidase